MGVNKGAFLSILRRSASVSVRGRCDNVGDDCGRAWSEVVRSLAMADYVSP